MKPLCSVCAFRIWKIRSCLRMPDAPATVRSLATWVSFWMLMSFRSVMFRPSCDSGVTSTGWPAAARDALRFWLLRMVDVRELSVPRIWL
jgi:hypothetical protein